MLLTILLKGGSRVKKAMSKNRSHFRKMPRVLTTEETKLVQGQGELPPPPPTPDVRAHIIESG